MDDLSTTEPERDTSNDWRSLTVATREGERRQSFRAVGVAVSKLAAPIIAKRGGATLVRLKAQWAAIIDAECAAVSWPHSLGRDGALKLRVAPGAALELQHRTPLLIERINLFFGRTVVSRLALVQGPLPIDSPAGEPGVISLATSEVVGLDERLSGIADPELRLALGRLGRAVLGGRV
jgi:hypothetical protein